MGCSSVRGLLRHELLQYASNKKQLMTLVVGVFVLIAAAGFPIAGMFADLEQGESRTLDSLKQRFPGYGDEAVLSGAAVEIVLSLVMLFGCGFWPAFLGATAIVGEKELRTLESLLLLPVSDKHILFGKVGPIALLPLVACWLGCAVAAIVAFLLLPSQSLRLLLNPRFAVTALLTAPAVAAMSALWATIPSVLVTDTNAAQRLCVIPSIGIMTALLALYAKVVILESGSVALVTFCVLALDVLLFGIAVRLFDRERLLLRYE